MNQCIAKPIDFGFYLASSISYWGRSWNYEWQNFSEIIWYCLTYLVTTICRFHCYEREVDAKRSDGMHISGYHIHECVIFELHIFRISPFISLQIKKKKP